MDAKYKVVIFDFDGTLVDTLADIAAAMNHALSAHGFPVLRAEEYRDKLGWGVFRLATLAMPESARTDENSRKLGNHALRFLEELPAEKTLSKPYPGIRELLKELKARKTLLAVLSNKSNSLLQQLTHDFFSPLEFDAVCGLRLGVAPKPDPAAVWEILADMGASPHEAIFAGDSEVDMETARSAGCYPLGVSWGFRSRDILAKAGAARIIDKPEDLWGVVGRR